MEEVKSGLVIFTTRENPPFSAVRGTLSEWAR